MPLRTKQGVSLDGYDAAGGRERGARSLTQRKPRRAVQARMARYELD